MVPRVPAYRRHPNGQAFIEHKSIAKPSHRLYLGKYGTPASKTAYQEAVNQILAAHSPAAAFTPGARPASISELVLAYLTFAEGHYRKDGKTTAEFIHIRTALFALNRMFGSTLGRDFGPRYLKALQAGFIRDDYERRHVNRLVGIVKRFFKWCCADELLPPELFHKLACVEGLRAGRGDVRENEPIKPVPRAFVDAVLPYLQPTVAAMVPVQYLCGMRPAEVCMMRPCDLNMSGPIWLYTPPRHKNAWRGHSLVKAVPRAAQAILKPFLPLDTAAYIFSPRASEFARVGKHVVRRGKEIRDHYDTNSYRRAIVYGFEKAKRQKVELVRWHPNQLRHLIATEISQQLGQQAAQRWLGHGDMDTTAIYAESEVSELIAIAQELDRRWAG